MGKHMLPQEPQKLSHNPAAKEDQVLQKMKIFLETTQGRSGTEIQ